MRDPSSSQAARGEIRDLVRLGVVAEVDRSLGRCMVDLGRVRTAPIPFAALRFGSIRVWAPPSEGEQVLLVMPEGDIERAIVVASVQCDAIPAPVDHDGLHIAFEDGSWFGYDPAAGYKISLADGVAAKITAPGGLDIVADVTIDGDVTVSKTLTAETDVVGGGKSLKTHKHLGVTTGAGVTGLPQ